MRLDLKPDVTLENLYAMIGAMLWLRQAQENLHQARLKKMSPCAIKAFEKSVYNRLDDLWEAQQRCLAI